MGYRYSENDELGGRDPYSASKAMAEIAIQSFRDSYFKNSTHYVSSVRAGNVIGGGDWAFDRIMTDFIISMHNNKPIEIRNPTAIRPWQYVLDVLNGYLTLGAKMEGVESFSHGSAWNFGPDEENEINVRSLAEKLKAAWGSGDIIERPDKSKHESHFLQLNSNKARTLLGWKPKFTLDQTIEKTVNWYKSYYEHKEDMAEYSLNLIKEYE